MARSRIEPKELSAEITDRLDGRQVRVAVFTSFSFDPGFFELHILPLLFDRSFSQNERVRRCQLEDALRSVDNIAVYYDRSALAQDAISPQLGFESIGVRRKTGVFHLKLIMLLVDEPSEDGEDETTPSGQPDQSLLVGIVSANLTRSGWWENVEVAHFEEIASVRASSKKCSFRKDLLGLLPQIKKCAPEDEKHEALDKIHEFLREDVTTDRPVNAGADGRQYTRIYYGQEELPAWLSKVKIASYRWNLEIVSPFFDKLGARALERLLDEVTPDETRLMFPKNDDGTGAVPEGFVKALRDMPKDRTVTWSELPPELTQRGRHPDGRFTPRHVHAKLYRFWKGGYSVCLVGSVNLTTPAHSSYDSGNLEAAFLVDTSDSVGGWWLSPLNRPPRLGELPDEAEDAPQEVCIDLSLKYDWRKRRAFYRYEGGKREILGVRDHTAMDLFTIQPVVSGKWIDCGDEAGVCLGKSLLSSSLLQVVDGENIWRILVREEGSSQRPSFVSLLTPEEILRMWSAVVPEHKQQVLEDKFESGTEVPPMPPFGVLGKDTQKDVTIFDRFAGVYHAFERFLKDVTEAIATGHVREAETRLCGEKYDSLPVLLKKVSERRDADPVMNYVTFLCAKQIREHVRSHHKEFCRTCTSGLEKLDEFLMLFPTLRSALPLEPGDDSLKFVAWYEDMFLRRRKIADRDE